LVLKKKKKKQGLDFWMKNKPMVLGLLKVGMDPDTNSDIIFSRSFLF
jgi:hypothetical protein